MALRVYNTLSRKKEVFKPIKKGVAHMYNCGPTVYGYAHIGNFRTYVFADVLRRYLEYEGYRVKQVICITDVGHLTQDDIEAGEDKIERAAKEKKVTPAEIARYYEADFVKQSKLLNLKAPHVLPRATEHIPEMINWIKKLIKAGHGYEANGSVYYDIASFKRYGRLSGNTAEALEAGASGRPVENKDKRHFYDFALWVNDPKHIMNWPSPWCEKGYPGWHLECTVLATKYLGKHFDIHTGGEDNIFPHHEAELAQAEGVLGKRWVNYWMHPRHLLVNNRKMSKSAGTFFIPQDIYDKGYSPRTLRWILLSTHYRQKFNFTLKGLEAASKVVQRLVNFIESLDAAKGNANPAVGKLVTRAKKDFEASMDEDLNISSAVAAVMKLITDVGKLLAKGNLSSGDAKKVRKQMLAFDKVFGILEMKDRELTADLKALIEKRDAARVKKDWKTSDKIRGELKKKGIILVDEPSNTRWQWI